MKFVQTLLPLAAITSAFVLPDEQMTNQIVLESQKVPSLFEKLQDNVEGLWDGVEESFKNAVAFSENALDNAFNAATDAAQQAKGTFECYMSMTKVDIAGFLDSAVEIPEDLDDLEKPKHPHKPHKPPHHRKPHHGHGHHKSNKTIYELISSSKYTTKLAELINEYPDLVETLNGTAANYTLFAPTDKAFEKIPKGHKKPSKELIKKVLAYHVSPDFYPAGRILVTHTIPTALGEDKLGGEPQRLRLGLSPFKGLNVNFYSKIIAVNIFGSNGVIHGVDSIILPPPEALTILSLLPTEFSTLQLGLEKTGLFKAIKASPHEGGTLFAPSNLAFKKLGPRINGFLFSKYGEKYLKALLKYHVVANQTLYSDAFYKAKSAATRCHERDEFEEEDIPKGYFHVDLPTLLDEKSLSIDVARYGGYINIKINGFSSVAVQDGIARDGVVHVVSSVLIPPKTPGAFDVEVDGEMDLDEFKQRLIPFLEDEL
jgi:uncharacterized surface protein with fasciclin (FAS1) repeats